MKDINDELIAFRARCCDDPKTDSWVTVSVLLSDDEHAAQLAAHTLRIATTHDRKLKRLAQSATVVKKAI